VSELEICAYQVCEKWLKDRKRDVASRRFAAVSCDFWWLWRRRCGLWRRL